MHVTIRAFSLPKAGNSASDYEDAAWPRKPFEGSSLPVRMAVADGATEASFSASWARMLVRDYGRGRLTKETTGSRLVSLQRRWRRLVGRRPLPWYAEEKLRDGAFSSLLGLTIRDDHEGDGLKRRWDAVAVGDSCLFQVRGGSPIVGFPLERAEQFDSRPVLLSSEPSRNGGLDDALAVISGSWEAGDVFYLMTDAMACWFLGVRERGGDPIPMLDDLVDADSFQRLVEEQRSAMSPDGRRLLKNDDVTFVRCRLGSPVEG